MKSKRTGERRGKPIRVGVIGMGRGMSFARGAGEQVLGDRELLSKHHAASNVSRPGLRGHDRLA